jgi:hypothetical protein
MPEYSLADFLPDCRHWQSQRVRSVALLPTTHPQIQRRWCFGYRFIISYGLGFVSRSLYLFPQFFEDKATEHLLGDGIEPKHLNDDKISRVMDKLGSSRLYVIISAYYL